MEKILNSLSESHPLVKIIEVDNNYYAYDAKSGLLTRLTHHNIQRIAQSISLSDVGIDKNDSLAKLFERGVFLPGPLKTITPDKEELFTIVNNLLQIKIPATLTIEVTESCNLACKYCLFANPNGFEKRSHTINKMSESIAYKAIDYYYDRYIDVWQNKSETEKIELIQNTPPTLRWWGGEPFMAFELIDKTKSYFENKGWHICGIRKDMLRYGLTSNMTILNDDIIRFLVNNKVNLRVSMDGGEKEHDANRVYITGEGSFKKVIDNLNRLLEQHPEYAKKQIGIESVFTDNIDELSAKNFIYNYFGLNTLNNKIVHHSISALRVAKRFISTNYSRKNVFADSEILSFKKRLDLIPKTSSEELNSFFKLNRDLCDEIQESLSINDHIITDNPQGTDYIKTLFSCSIAADKLFVSVDGSFHFCCKSDYSMPFGNIESGIDITKLCDFLSSFHKKVEEKCKGCWAFRFCNICPALTAWGGDFILPGEEECSTIKYNSLIKLYKYIIINEDYDFVYSFFKEEKN